jgi:DNA-binding MarR family transcriptional regulator
VDVVVLLNMNMHWRQKRDFPFPRPAIIAKRMGISKRTVERRIGKLVKAGLLERLPVTKEGHLRRYKLNELTLSRTFAARSPQTAFGENYARKAIRVLEATVKCTCHKQNRASGGI